MKPTLHMFDVKFIDIEILVCNYHLVDIFESQPFITTYKSLEVPPQIDFICTKYFTAIHSNFTPLKIYGHSCNSKKIISKFDDFVSLSKQGSLVHL